jgi:hypothetical protein
VEIGKRKGKNFLLLCVVDHAASRRFFHISW